MHDVLIIGGGVIGLSLAWELARRGKSVQVIDQGQPGREASWAGAGILPAANRATAIHPLDQLRALASELHPAWAQQLRNLTGIDNGYRRCGGLYLARTPGEAAALAAWAQSQSEEEVAVQKLTTAELRELEPGLCFHEHSDEVLKTQDSVLSTQYSVPRTNDGVARFGRPANQTVPRSAYLIPAEAQLRNPRHLKALLAACQQARVTIIANIQASDFVVRGGELAELLTPSGPLRARQFCFTAGSWTGQILARLGIAIGILPVRGQMVLFRCESAPGGPMTRILNEGSRYIVPRDDGYVLAGSTEEEVGFDKRTTEEAIADLTTFARDLVPALQNAKIERTWAGLRPGSFDGLPYLGPLPGIKNAFVAAGHFRTGLYLSPATAIVMSELMCGEQPQIDLSPFRVGR